MQNAGWSSAQGAGALRTAQAFMIQRTNFTAISPTTGARSVAV